MKHKKDVIRRRLRQERSQLSSTEQRQKSQKIIDHILQSNMFKNAKHIGFYHAVRGEANPESLSLFDEQKHFYLPVLATHKQQGLVFAPINSKTQYQNNSFNIPEPVCPKSQLIQAKELDLLIMPLLGFDKAGNRLGMGGGYYDRCLAYKQKAPETKPILMGFAYNFQEVESLHAEPWDISLDWVATEDSLLDCEKLHGK